MSYKVLARKWRPNDFSEVVGQEHVFILANSLDKNKIHQALCFKWYTRGRKNYHCKDISKKS